MEISDDKPISILIIDDSPGHQDAFIQYLKFTGCHTTVIKDGKSGIQKAKQILPDLILLDVMMPGMNGYEVCTLLKQEEITRAIPVIFITGMADVIDKIKGFRVGAVDYITKPLQHEEAFARIQTHLTIRKQQKKLEIQTQKLERLNQEKMEILRMVSHDLKNPLTNILGSIQCLKIGIDNPKLITMLENNTRRMFQIVTDLLDLDKIQSGGVEFQWIKVDLREAISQVMEQYHHSAAAKQIDLHFPGKETYVIMADSNALKQIIDNLLSNAIKYSPMRTAIRIAIKEQEQYIRMLIADQGPGLSQQEINKIFTQFAKLDAKPTGGESSTGVGLSITKSLVETMKGKIWVESDGKGKGSTFLVDFAHTQ